MDSSSKRLLRLVEDFVSVTKIEAGKLQPQLFSQKVGAALKGTVEAFCVKADGKGLKYSVSLPDETVTAELDWGLVQRAASNLIENAINYTPKGGEASFSAFRTDEGIVVEVSDNGPGIAPEETERVFEKYYRSRKTAMIKGTGLGLAIVKAVAESHGGRAELDSEVGRGSRFRMVMPG
jgi:signal transduction histidine kinase